MTYEEAVEKAKKIALEALELRKELVESELYTYFEVLSLVLYDSNTDYTDYASFTFANNNEKDLVVYTTSNAGEKWNNYKSEE